MKRTPADIAFSKCIRTRDDWTCQKCGTKYPDDAAGLECSHFITRASWGVRFCPENAEALCTSCHFKTGGRRDELPDQVLDILREKQNDKNLAKRIRQTKGKGEIAKHFRNQHAILMGKRLMGEPMELEGWE